MKLNELIAKMHQETDPRFIATLKNWYELGYEQAKNEMLSSATVVYGIYLDSLEPIWGNDKVLNPTHKALLINIEPIVKEPCSHDPGFPKSSEYNSNHETKCIYCGVELVAEWKVKS